MRQAGRYLPEYQEVRRKAGGFLEMCRDPELAAEVTLQPVRRFGVDAAIIFSDILLPLQAMGMPLVFEEGRGPVLPGPLRDERRISKLKVAEPSVDLGYVGEALRLVRARLDPQVALLGFCGAPFTLACYAIEGGTSRTQVHVRRMMYHQPELFAVLMDKLADVVISHLRFQAESGADALVVFDTWAGQLARDDWRRFAAPALQRVFDETAGLRPRLLFTLDGGHVLDEQVALGPEGLAVDWRVDLPACLDRHGGRVAVQGNLDPAVLLAPPEEVARRTAALLAAVGGRPGHVLALGHGVMKETDPEAVAAFVETAREGAGASSAQPPGRRTTGARHDG
jgi:uroporphyrinogen decarboxylase